MQTSEPQGAWSEAYDSPFSCFLFRKPLSFVSFVSPGHVLLPVQYLPQPTFEPYVRETGQLTPISVVPVPPFAEYVPEPLHELRRQTQIAEFLVEKTLSLALGSPLFLS